MCKHRLCLMPFSVSSVPDFLPDTKKLWMFFEKTKDYNNEGERGRIQKKKKNSKTKDQGREKWEKTKQNKTLSGRIEGVRQCHQG